MKKQNLTLFLALVATFTATAQITDSAALARVPVVNAKKVFYHATPVTEYQVAFTFENIIYNIECFNPAEIMAASVYNANIEAARQGEYYDAIIVSPNTPRDIAIVFNNKKDAANNLAEVLRIDGMYVFKGMEPLKPYNVAYKRQTGKGKAVCPSDSKRVAELTKAADKQDIEYDAVYITNTVNDLLIEF